MAALPASERRGIWATFMRQASSDRQNLGLTKAQLRAAVDAADQWVEDNAGSYNQALPVAARSALTTAQKTRLLFFVASKRFEVI